MLSYAADNLKRPVGWTFLSDSDGQECPSYRSSATGRGIASRRDGPDDDGVLSKDEALLPVDFQCPRAENDILSIPGRVGIRSGSRTVSWADYRRAGVPILHFASATFGLRLPVEPYQCSHNSQRDHRSEGDQS